ncbi:tRNA (adenine(58)-N(1))-methyltransferase non-catalytic subunit TRM6, putative (GCD10) [Plasmodium ovale wallikeri]|uniref:tRNA (adenine(58)-N(1))-methyltransferase non-catalytic subunit TRM6 n=2 Tax=Plasmodium ovale TaxID=36330 RepID=A0A1A8YQS3_PLAOA|nr:tRNA (adenine(58)-N(1))-methyltransferase non-catalytic subunit TRM6, putative (GCD10) [Plasmodium ovale wallikeri]SBT56502.1 tRNA (adenine(58)-N(1))-methyltransferase non-catalytic subunit TRM6, putative (GCD10) [Plasmodium ovale wallikeri]SBT76323.1 tRNA (adenine(58)-N(1))-methyltransferase non-catalytic subunit TRM6, putative [Plasmodium ovale]
MSEMKIKKHDFVLIDDELKCRLHKIVDMKVKIKTNYINLLFLVNKKYGSTYTFIKNKWVRSKKKKEKLDISFSDDIEGTNKEIFHNKNSQKLSDENIAQLKDTHLENPYEIVQKLVDNSTTFNSKTVISKFKYVQKKLKRHFCQFTVYECNIVNLINFYYKYFPGKISNVRIDYLANILFHISRDLHLKSVKKIDTAPSDQKHILSIVENQVKSITEEENQVEGNTVNENKGNNFQRDEQGEISFFKHNVLIYDDSFGLLTSVLNIIYGYNVNIFSLIYKNICNTIIPSFGIKKNTKIVNVGILYTDGLTRINKHVFLDRNLEFTHPLKSENAISVTSPDTYLPKCPATQRSSEPMDKLYHGGGNISGEINQSENCHVQGSYEFSEQKNKRKINEIDNQDNVNICGDSNDKRGWKKRRGREEEESDKIEYSENEEIKEMLQDLQERKAESFVIVMSSEFTYNTKVDVCIFVDTLVKISLKYLNSGGKIIVHTDDINITNLFMKLLIETNTFIHIRLNEFILREQQVVKRRTHPLIKNAKLADGFLLTAIKVEN